MALLKKFNCEELSEEHMFSVVIPVHDEQDNIQALIAEIAQHCASFKQYEIIVVNDASRDTTLQKLQEIKSSYPMLRILCHDQKLGQSAGIRTGAIHANYDVIVMLDGDGQNDPADIPNLLNAFWANQSKNVGLVIGHRVNRHDSSIRKIASKIANGIRGSLLKDNAPDSGCGLKVISKQLFLELPYFDHIHRFVPALVKRADLEVMVVPVNHRERVKGRSKYAIFDRLWVGIVDLFGVWWLQKRYRAPKVVEEK